MLANAVGPMIPAHWAIENSLHWVMDKVFRDDECRVRIDNAPANFATCRHIAYNLTPKAPSKDSIRLPRKTAGWDDEYLASLVAAYRDDGRYRRSGGRASIRPGGSFGDAEMRVIDKGLRLSAGRAAGTGGVRGNRQHVEAARERVIGQQPADQRISHADQQLESFGRHHRSHHSRQHAHNPCLRAGRCQLGWRRLREEAAITGARSVARRPKH